MRVAVIDLGTFSAILLITESMRGRLVSLHEERSTIDLEYGRGNIISSPGLERARRTLRRFSRVLKEFRIDRGMLVATAAIRHARNRSRAVALLGEECELPFRILSPRQEAKFSAHGALIGLPKVAPSSLIVDIGGGSSEFIRPQTDAFRGLPIGAAWATKAWGARAPRDRIRRDLYYLASAERAVLRFDPRKFGDITDIVAIGGTITTLAAIKHRMKSFDAATVHGTWLAREWIDGLASEMAALSDRAIRGLVPFDTSRARILLAGTYLWSAVLNRLNADRVMVSARGLRWGVAAHLAGLP